MRYVAYTTLLFTVLLAASCQKTKSPGVTGGGKGGNVTMSVTAAHSTILVDSVTVYIKYGTLDAPQNGVYDDSATGILIDTTATATIPSLTAGQYYLYAFAYHANYNPPFYKGGLSFTINQQQAAGIDTLHIVIPVAPAF